MILLGNFDSTRSQEVPGGPREVPGKSQEAPGRSQEGLCFFTLDSQSIAASVWQLFKIRQALGGPRESSLGSWIAGLCHCQLAMTAAMRCACARATTSDFLGFYESRGPLGPVKILRKILKV